MQYEDVAPVTKNEAERAFKSLEPNQIVNALLGITYFDADWEWVQDWCLHFLESKDVSVRNAAIACLGHLARIHKTINKPKVLGALRNHIKDASFEGRIEDAIDDIEMFAK